MQIALCRHLAFACRRLSSWMGDDDDEDGAGEMKMNLDHLQEYRFRDWCIGAMPTVHEHIYCFGCQDSSVSSCRRPPHTCAVNPSRTAVMFRI